MTLAELLTLLDQQGIISVTTPLLESGLTEILDRINVDADTPIPVWNEDAQAWEV